MEAKEDRLSLQHLAAGLLAYLGVVLGTLFVSRLFEGCTVSLSETHTLLMVGIGALVCSIVYAGERLRSGCGTTALAGVMAVLWGAVILNIAFGVVATHSYGDRGFVGWSVESGKPFPRWLGGTAVLSWVYAALWKSPLLESVLPGSLRSVDAFVKCAGATVSAFSAILGLCYTRAFLVGAIPTTLALYLLFASGHDEYYPFIAGPFLLILLWLFHTPLEQRGPVEIGLVCAVLAVLYAPFVLVAVIILCCYGVGRPGQVWKAILLTVGTGFALIDLLWPTTVTDYFAHLHEAMNLGERNIVWEPYVGQSASPHSPYFRTAYALSAAHAREVAHMVWFGGGAVAVGLAVVGTAAQLLGRFRRVRTVPGADGRLLLAVLLGLQQAHYLVFMMPRLGPRQDVDLFFSVYIVAAVMAASFSISGGNNHPRADPCGHSSPSAAQAATRP